MGLTRLKKRSSARRVRAPAISRNAKNTAKQTLDVQGRAVPVSNLDKIFYPKTGFTKAQIIDYYIRISPVLLPHLKDRPLTLKRYPDGVDGGFFYEKRCPSYRPSWLQTAPIWSDHHQANINYC